jgi:DCC1-like thiol-disulfide oxidoreductase
MLISGASHIETRLSGGSQLSSLILIDGNAIYTESDAVLEILARLRPPWSWIALLRIIPRPAMPATVSSSAIGTNGSAELKSARSHQRTSDRDSSNEPAATRSSSRHVLAEHD